MNNQRRSLTDWRVYGAVATLAVVVALTIPRAAKIPAEDDFDYIHDIMHRPFTEYLFKTNPTGQFTPVHRAVYAVGLLAFDFYDVPLQWLAMIVRLSTAALLILLLSRSGTFTIGGALLCAATTVVSVGLMDVYFWPLSLAEELALLAIPLALVLLEEPGAPTGNGRLLAASAVITAGALSYGIGFVPPVALAVAYSVVAVQDRRVRDWARKIIVLWATCFAILVLYLFVAKHGPLHGSILSAPAHFAAVSRFFFYGTVVNGALSGLLPGVFPGWVHVLFYGTLLAATAWLFKSGQAAAVKVIAATLLFSQLGIGALLALTKWPLGVRYATSLRYIFPNAPLELALLALVLGAIVRRHADSRSYFRYQLAAAAVGFSIFACAIVGAIHGRNEHLRFEARRRACLEQIIADRDSEQCIGSLYYAKDADRIRGVLADLQRRPGFARHSPLREPRN